MEDASLNSMFLKAIESFNYTKEEQRKYLNILDSKKKIQTIASLYTIVERKSKIVESLEELKSRHSLINLLFLRYTIETMSMNCDSKKEIWNFFVERNGIETLEFGFRSNNESFLNNLTEFAVHIVGTYNCCTNLLKRIFSKYDLISKEVTFAYVNMKVDRRALYESKKMKEYNMTGCLCSLFIKTVVDDILSLNSISNELEFVLEENVQISKLIDEKYLRSTESKFTDKNFFQKLCDALISVKMPPRNKNKGEIPEESEIRKPSYFLEEKSRSKSLQKPSIMHKCQSLTEENAYTNNKNNTGETHLLNPEQDKLIKIKKTKDQFDKLKEENIALKEELLKAKNARPKTTALDMLSKIHLSNKNTKKIAQIVFDYTSKDDKKAVQNSNTVMEKAITPTQSKSVKKIFGRPISAFKAETTPIEDAPNTAAYAPAVASCTITDLPKSSLEENTASQIDVKPPEAKKPARTGLGKLGSKLKAKKPILVSNKSYSGLKWKKSSQSSCQIFAKIQYETSEKMFKLEEFDEFENVQEKKIDVEIKQEKSVSVVKNECCMDSKKSYALNIALGRIRCNNKDLISKICSHQFDDENVIRQLIMYFPTEDEVSMIKNTSLQLSRAEMFFREADDLKKLNDALISLRFSFVFKSKDFAAVFCQMSEAFQRLLASTELLNLFGILLVIGNVLNSNTYNGNAEGFTLDSLEYFTKDTILNIVRRKVNKPRLIHELFGESKELSLIKDGFSVESIVYEFNEVKSMFIEESVDQCLKSEFYLALEKFKIMHQFYKQAQDYFGESDDKFILKIENFVKKLK